MNDEQTRIPVGQFTTIFKRGKKGTYTADFHHNGKHCRRSLRTSNLRVARQRAVELELEITNGTLSETMSAANPAPMTIRQAADEFLDYLETEKRRPKTRKKYRGILLNFASFSELGNVERLADVDMRLIDKFRAHRKPLVGPKSMHHEGVLLKGFLGWCRQRKLIAENPLAEVKFRRPKPPRRGGPTLEQINAILVAADERRRPILAVLAFTGMRSGESQHLRAEDVDLRGNWLHIESREGYETKTGECRDVPIHPRLRPFLQRQAKHARSWFFTGPATPKYPDGSHHINTKRLNEYFLGILKKLGLPTGRDGGFTIHSLRHAFKIICINAGIPREVVDAWQGHSPDRSAGGAYYRLSAEESQRFMEQVPFGTGKPAADAGDTEV